MKRREVVAAVASAVALAGCTDSESTPRSEPTRSGRSSRTEPGQPVSTATAPTDRESDTESCEWPDMCAGTKLVEVTVADGFSGEVVLNAACRDGTDSVAPGETVSVTRRTDAEPCDIRLTVDGEQVFDRSVSGSATYYLTVAADGSLRVSMAVL